MARLSWLVVLALGCTSGEGKDGGPDGVTDGGTLPPPVAGCEERQPWPIDDQGHQLDRVDPGLAYGAFYWVPDNPRGLVIFNHANAKSASTLLTIEHEELWNELARRDLAYGAVDSVERDWDFSGGASNRDVQRIAEFRDLLIAETALTEDTPVFGVGFSGGGSFLGPFATGGLELGWDVRAISAHGSTPSGQPPVTAVFVSHENDSPDGAASAHEDWLAAGLDSELYALPEEPLDPLRFTREPSVPAEISERWFDDLVDMGAIDADGNRLIDIRDAGATIDDFKRLQTDNGVPGGALAAIQLNVVWRLHIYSADVACEEAEAFENAL